MYVPNITYDVGRFQTTCSIPNIWDSTVITNVHFHLNVSFIPLLPPTLSQIPSMVCGGLQTADHMYIYSKPAISDGW